MLVDRIHDDDNDIKRTDGCWFFGSSGSFYSSCYLWCFGQAVWASSLFMSASAYISIAALIPHGGDISPKEEPEKHINEAAGNITLLSATRKTYYSLIS